MLVCLLCLLPLQTTPEIKLPSGSAIVLDGKMDGGEWSDAFSLTRPMGKGRLRFAIKRTGPWLAIGLDADQRYDGEMMRVSIADEAASWVVSLFMPIGLPALYPALWLRGSPMGVLDPKIRPECPRAVRLRTLLGRDDKWSAEYLIRLSSLGIGRADLRKFRIFLMVTASPAKRMTRYIELPTGVRHHGDAAKFAPLIVAGGWGADETWAPVPAEVSREWDDHELLFRLTLEHEKIVQHLEPDQLVISNAVIPRSESKIRALRARIEAGRRRNPTLTSWTYFLGRLLHEGNHRAEARKLLDSLPPAMAAMGPFLHLNAESYIDAQECEKAIELLKGRMQIVLGSRELVATARRVMQELAEETKVLAAEAKRQEKNPRLRIVTKHGAIEIELFEDDAPCAVRNFMDLVLKQKFFDGLTFHNVIGGNIAMAGDPRTRPGATIKTDNPGWRLRSDKPKRPLLRGYLAMVQNKDGTYNGSQFVITVSPLGRGDRVVFGRVVAGQDVVERIEQDDRIERIEVIAKRNHAYDPLDCRLR